MSKQLWWPAAVAAVSAFVLVGLVRQFAIRHGVLDHPGDRSSHAVATPRGGGLGLLLAVLALWTWRATDPLVWTVLVVLGGTGIVALVGWIDDRGGLPVPTRLAVHIVAAAGLAFVASVDSKTALIGVGLFLGWSLWTVSSINLVNFMDGINGLVASQVAVFAISLALLSRPGNTIAFYAITLAAACIGFLPWNYPRARIFLGDVGSGGLGYLVPALALLAMREQGIDILRAHLPLLPLFGDATSTILRRWQRGERLTEAHRSHLYQRLANGRLNHSAVTAIYAVVALGGVAAAHLSRSPKGWFWLLAYVASTLVAGLVLEHVASAGVRARA